jgi:hypothetical protein
MHTLELADTSEQRILDVLPGSIPGMEYTTRGLISGWQVRGLAGGSCEHFC